MTNHLGLIISATAKKSRNLAILLFFLVPVVFVFGAGLKLIMISRQSKYTFARDVGILLLGMSLSGLMTIASLVAIGTGWSKVWYLAGQLCMWLPAVNLSWSIFSPKNDSVSDVETKV